MGSYSPYSVNEADPPKPRPGEDIASAAFVGISLYLFVEVNVLIFRAFKKRQGLYFWSIQIGSLGIFMESIGIILKSFASPSTNTVWPLYTLFIEVGWTAYTTAFSLVLYSRLHLVERSQRIQRYVFLMILSTIFTFIIPSWVVFWPSNNTLDPEMSSRWSPRFAIVMRYTQIGHTITESIISGLYIWSLTRLLKLKANVRQRRVMADLLCVNVMAIGLDVLLVILIYTNQVGIRFHIQNFSYIFKLRLEFAVLNQLMNVAARGMRRGSLGKSRYYHTVKQKNMSVHENAPSQEGKDSHLTMKKDISKDPAQTALESSMPLSDSISSLKSTYQLGPTNRSGSDVQTFGQESESEAKLFDNTSNADRKSSSYEGNPLPQKAKLGAGFFDKLPRTFQGFKNRSSGPSNESKDSKLIEFRRGDHSHRGNSADNEDDEGGIELQMWERRGTAVVDIPWFRSKVEV